jgi:hypothetical protein
MTAKRLAPLLALMLCLAACQDARRDAARDYLQSHPPENFSVVEIPEKIGVTSANESVVPMKYKLATPTVREFDLLAQPRATALLDRVNAVRGWALSSLPAGNPIREQIASLSATAREPFPVKRIVTPAGTVVDALVTLKFAKSGSGWQVAPASLDVWVRGIPDKRPDIPLESSPQAAAKIDSLAFLAAKLEDIRKEYLEERQLAAERSLAALRSRLQTGNTFQGDLPGLATTRLIVTRGFDAGEPVSVVLTVQRGMQSSARYVGAVTRQPSGESIWRAAQITPLSARVLEPATDPSSHPILTLIAVEKGLAIKIQTASRTVLTLTLRSTGRVDLIPDSIQ